MSRIAAATSVGGEAYCEEETTASAINLAIQCSALETFTPSGHVDESAEPEPNETGMFDLASIADRYSDAVAALIYADAPADHWSDAIGLLVAGACRDPIVRVTSDDGMVTT